MNKFEGENELHSHVIKKIGDKTAILYPSQEPMQEIKIYGYPP